MRPTHTHWNCAKPLHLCCHTSLSFPQLQSDLGRRWAARSLYRIPQIWGHSTKQATSINFKQNLEGKTAATLYHTSKFHWQNSKVRLNYEKGTCNKTLNIHFKANIMSENVLKIPLIQLSILLSILLSRETFLCLFYLNKSREKHKRQSLCNIHHIVFKVTVVTKLDPYKSLLTITTTQSCLSLTCLLTTTVFYVSEVAGH